MGKTDGAEQLEYIRKWQEMKEQKKEEKLHRKRMKKFHLERAKWYFAKAMEELKLIFGKGE